jgi:hypothetical protein
VVRQRSAPLGTPGAVTLLNGFVSDTLELPWHGNERGRSCIAADEYRGWVWQSPTLRRPVIRLEDKHGRQDCLVHNGNWAADEVDLDGDGAPEVTQVHGCTEVGRGYGEVRRRDGRLQWGILRSGATLDELIRSLEDGLGGHHEVLLTYVWAPGCAP